MWVYLYTEEQEWQPWANTVAYYPLTDDFNDKSWNSRNLSVSWPTITILNWVKCAYYNWSWYSSYNGFSLGRSSRTANVWIYVTNSSWWVLHISNYQSSSPQWSLWLQTVSNTIYTADWVSGASAIQSWALTQWWHNAVVTQEWNTMKLYIDWLIIWTLTNYPSELYSPNWWALWSKLYSGYSEKRTWYLSEVILEDKVRTAQEVLNYYNLTKSNYWL